MASGQRGTIGRRTVLKSTAMLAMSAAARAQEPASLQPATTFADVPVGPAVTLIVERRGDIVLVGLNRPFIQSLTRRRGSDWW